MALDPIPYVVADSAPAVDAPGGAIPISLFGGGVGIAPTFDELPGAVTGVAGAHLQAILEDLATRLGVVEGA